MSQSQPLAGQIALITGGGSGIGRATALRLAACGATVIVAGRRVDALQETVATVHAAGGLAHAVTVDLHQQASIQALAAQVLAAHGGVDMLIHNAGASSRVRNLLYLEPRAWADVVTLNLDAVFQLTQALLPSMLSKGNGLVVAVSSGAARNPGLLAGAPYGAAKAAVANLMGYLRSSYRAKGIRATTIFPGEIDTAILDGRPRPPTAEERAGMCQSDDVAAAIELVCTLPARATIEELVINPTKLRDMSADMAAGWSAGAPASAA